MIRREQLRFLAPNLLTCSNVALGVVAMAMALDGRTELAAWLIVVTVLLDKLDGTVARLLGASSRFGEQLDSFSDLISFGVAPSVLFFSFALTGPSAPPSGETGAFYRVAVYSCGVLYVIAATLRLAKFNVVGVRLGREFFFGLPTTVAGAMLVTLYLTVVKYSAVEGFPLTLDHLRHVYPVLQVVLALWMVSELPLPKLRPRRSRVVHIYQIVTVVLAYVVGLTWFLVPPAWRFPEFMLFSCLLYMIAGSVWAHAKGIRPVLTD